MSITIQDAEGNDVDVFVSMEGGRLGAMVRCPDEATFDAQALAVGLMEYSNPGAPAVTDDEGNIVTSAVEPSGPLKPVRHVTIAKIGALTLTPGTYDDEGNEVTPPTYDNRFHANFWLGADVVDRGLWKQWAIAWTLNGQDVAQVNADEVAKVLNNIELIDPATVRSPSNTTL